MESANGVSGEKGGPPPPPSPLTGCYLLIVVGEPFNEQNKDIILQRIAKGLLSWDLKECLVDLEKELAIITEQALEGEEARYGERLIQFASENLVTEILIHPAVSTLAQCMRNLLSSFTRHRHIIHAGYTFAANGSWALQDGTFSYVDFSEAFQEPEVQRVVRAYDNGITMDIHCSQEGDWIRLPKEQFAKACKVRINPTDVLTSGSPAISGFVQYLSPFLVPISLENLLESSDVVGNIRFSRPTLYVFPGGQGDAALFGINGFNMLLDGGYSRKACFWDFVRHLDRLDAVLMTRLNNSNVGGISSVLRRKKQDALYPQIGHFFCNILERKSILSPDGDKDKDPLLINLLDEGQEIISNLRHLNLNPQVCYRDSEPINLYHKVGHGTLDMYVLSPAKDSKEVREFLIKWNHSDQKLFANAKSSRDFSFPIQNLISISALLVWRPANPNDTITRILYPGSCPQNKILEGLDRLKNLEFIKHSTCTEKSLAPISTMKKTAKEAIFDKIIPKERPPIEKKENKLIENDLPPVNGDVKEKDKIVKKSDSTESDRSTKAKKLEEPKIIENGDKPKPKLKAQKPRGESQQRRKPVEKKSPTLSKKPVENGDIKKHTKQSPISTPAKSAKDASNRKVIENKAKKEVSKAQLPSESKPKPEKVERKPISRRPPIKKAPLSPAKKLVNGIQKPDSISRKGKLDKEGTTDSSTVSTPSADQESVLKKDISKLTPEELQQMKAQELAEFKEEQEAVKELEAVFRKGEGHKVEDEALRKIKDISIDDKLEPEEYLIIEKEVIEQVSIEEKETKDENQKLARDSEESEKQRKASTEEQEEDKQKIQEQLNGVSTEIKETPKQQEEPIVTSKVTSPEEKNDVSTDKKITDKEGDDEVKDIAESQPEEKVSANIKSGDTTTAPTLPEDERIPLDEIKEDIGPIEEKHVKEDTKEKEIPAIHVPPKTFENVSKLPAVVGIRLDKQQHIRDIVKTPDEVADLPVHEEVDYEYTHELKVETPKSNEIVEKKDEQEKEVGMSKEQLKEETEKDLDEVLVRKSSMIQDELKTLTDTVLKNELEKDILKDYDETTKEKVETKLESTDTKKDVEKDENNQELEATETKEQESLTRKKRSLDFNETEIVEKEEIKEVKEDTKEVKEAVKKDTQDEVREFKADTKEEVKMEVKEDTKENVREEVKADTKDEVKEVKDEVKEEGGKDTKEEVKEEVNEKTKVKLDTSEVKAETKDEITEFKEESQVSTNEVTKDITKGEISILKVKDQIKIQEGSPGKELDEKVNGEILQVEEITDGIKEDSAIKEVFKQETKEHSEEKIEDGKSVSKDKDQISPNEKEPKIQEDTPIKEIIKEEDIKETESRDEEKTEVVRTIDDVHDELNKISEKTKHDRQETVDQMQDIEDKLQGLRDALVEPEVKAETRIEIVGIKEEKINDDIEKVADILSDVDKFELGRKSPKEREEDVMKIVAGVAEVLKSEVPLEKFEAKIPITTSFSTYTAPYPTELRETHITTIDSPTIEMKVINTDIPPIPEEPHYITASFLEEERKIAPIHEADSTKPEQKSEGKRNSLLKESQELMMATSKMLSDIRSGKTEPEPESEENKSDVDKPEEESTEGEKADDVGRVHRMLVTASSEDGGEEIEICPVGTITFSRSSESSGRSSPDPSHKASSQKSSIVDTISDTLSTVRQVAEIHSEKDSGIDDAEQEKDEKDLPNEEKQVSGKSTPDKDASTKSLASGKSTPDISDTEKSKEISSIEEVKKDLPIDNVDEKQVGILDRIGQKIEETLTSVEELIHTHKDVETEESKASTVKEKTQEPQKMEKVFEETSYSISAVTSKPNDFSKDVKDISEAKLEDLSQPFQKHLSNIENDFKEIKEDLHDKTDKISDQTTERDIKAAANDDFTKYTDLIEQSKDSLIKEVQEAEDGLKETKHDTQHTIKEQLTEKSQAISEDLKDQIEEAKEGIKELKDDIAFKQEKHESTVNNVVNLKEDIADKKDALESIIKDAQDSVSEKKAEVTADLQDTTEQIERVKDSVLKDIIDSKVTIIHTIEDKVSDISKTIEDEKDEVKTTIEESKKDIIEKTDELIETAEKVKADLTTEKASILEEIDNIDDDIKSTVHDSLKDSKDMIKDVKESVSQDIKDVGKHILQTTEDLKTVAQDTATEQFDNLIEKKDQTVEKLTEFKDKIKDKKEELDDEITKKVDELTIKKDGILGGIKNFNDDILGKVEDLGTVFQEQVKEKSGKLEETKEDLVEDFKVAKETVLDKKEELKSAAHEAVEEKVDDFSKKADQIKESVKDIKDDLVDKNEAIKLEIRESLDDLVKKKDEVIDEAKSLLKDEKAEAESIAQEISESIITTKESVLQAANDTKDTVEAGFHSTLHETVDDLSKAKDHISDELKDIKDDILDKKDKIESEVHSAVDKKTEDIISSKNEIKDEIEDIKHHILIETDKVETDIYSTIEAKVDNLSKKEAEAIKLFTDRVEDTSEIIQPAVGNATEELELSKEIEADLDDTLKDANQSLSETKDDVLKLIKDSEQEICDQKDKLEADIHESFKAIIDAEKDIEDSHDKKQEIKTDLIDSVKSAKADILDKNETLESDAKEKIGDIKDHAKELQENAKELQESVDEKKDKVEAIKDNVVEKADKSAMSIHDTADEKIDGLKEIKEDILKQAENAKRDIADEKNKLVDGKQTIKEIDEEVKHEIDSKKQETIEAVSTTKDSLDKDIRDFKDSIVEQKDAFESAIDEQFDKTKADVLQSTTSIKDELLDTKEKFGAISTQKLDDLSTKKDDKLGEIKQEVEDLVKETKETLDEVTDSLLKEVTDVKRDILDKGGNIESTIAQHTDDLLKKKDDILKDVKNKKENLETSIKDKAVEKVADFTKEKDELLSKVNDIEDTFRKDIHGAVADLSKKTDQVNDAMADTIKETKDTIIEQKEKLETKLKDKVDDVSKAKEELSENLNKIKSSAAEETAKLGKSIQDSTKEKIDHAKALKNELVDSASDVCNGVLDKTDKATESVQEICMQTKDNLKTEASNIVDKVGNGVQETVTTIKDETIVITNIIEKGLSEKISSFGQIFSKTEPTPSTSEYEKIGEKETPKTKDDKSPSEIETMDEKMAKSEGILEEAANDLEDTFENILNMTQSVIFNKCDEPYKENKALEEGKAEAVLEKSSKDLEETFEIVEDMSKSLVFEKCDSPVKSTSVDFGESSAEKLEKFDELEKGEKETMEKSKKETFKEDSNQLHSEIQITPPDKNEQKTVEICDKDTSKSIRDTSIKEETKEFDKQKEIQDNLLHEKQFPGRITPPTAPVSPNITDDVKFTATTGPLVKNAGLVEAEITSDFSSQHLSTQVLDRESDDEEEQYSITSQVAHSRDSSHGDFDLLRNQDPMSMSFYGALPGEEDDLHEISKPNVVEAPADKIDSKKEEETSAAQASSSIGQEKKDPIETWGKPLELPAPTCLYEITKAKYSTPGFRNEEGSDEHLASSFRGSQAMDLMTASFYGDLPTASNDPIHSWGKPLGLPSPAAPNDNKGTPKKEKKLPATVTAKNKLNDDKKRAESPSKYNKNKKINPVYVDLTYVPHHGNTYYAYVDFFRRVRARYYVFSGIEPSREVYNALLEAKQTWEDKELEVTIIPTYDTDILGYWVAENEELLTKCKIDLSPSASRCTINLQDHETSCSAYRLEF